jgi:hypothetical protein
METVGYEFPWWSEIFVTEPQAVIGGGAAGVTELDAVDATELPAALIATTVKV